jgi:hypothetical protein
MSKITIAQDKIKAMMANYKGDRQGVEYALSTKKNGVGFAPSDDKGTKVELDLRTCPEDFLHHLMDNSPDLTPLQRAALINWLMPDGGLNWDDEIDSASRLHAFISSIAKPQFNAEIKLLDRWYPIKVTSNYTVDQQHGPICRVRIDAKIALEGFEQEWHVTNYHFLDRNEQKVTYKARQIMDKWFMLRPVEQNIEEFNRICDKADREQTRMGITLDIIGSALIRTKAMWGAGGWAELPLGEVGAPSKCIIDGELERDVNRRDARREADHTKLPFVRAFSLETKRWCFVDVRDTADHAWDKGALDRLFLPEDMGAMLKALFQTQVKQLFGDVIKGKHGGMIILANGPTGVGKTLTAEVFAEYTQRPLYVMEMFELGVNVKEVEGNLEVIFKRVTRWNAVLLMDECDIFLQERGLDLSHNVMVGIFLRLMDYYKGLLFMTSNRGDKIDDAFKSRITLKLDYPKLDRSTRKQIWETMLGLANVTVEDGLDGIPDVELNGRQIRNMVRLIRAVHGVHITSDQVKEVVKFACK